MKTRVLTERVLDASSEKKDGILTERVVYFPSNGCVVRQKKDAKGEVLESEILIRLVYGNRTRVELVLDALKRHEEQAGS